MHWVFAQFKINNFGLGINKLKTINNNNMTVEEQIARLNKTTWMVITMPDVYNKSNFVNIAQVVDELYEDGYEVVMGDSEYGYTVGELRVIERLIA